MTRIFSEESRRNNNEARFRTSHDISFSSSKKGSNPNPIILIISTQPQPMTIITTNNHQSSSTSTVDNNNHYYPSSPAVLIDDDDTPQQYPLAATAPIASASSEPIYNNHATSSYDSYGSNYASAQVLESEASPYNPQLAVATDTYATATPLDPWSKAPTTSTEMMASNNTTTSTNNDPSSSVNVVQPTHGAPDIFLEDPLHKKRRRRRRRKGRMYMSGVAGFVMGTVALGPVGGIIFAISGAVIVRKTSKNGERRKDRRVQRQLEHLQQEASQPQHL
jgi:hypothetical protein